MLKAVYMRKLAGLEQEQLGTTTGRVGPGEQTSLLIA